MGVNSFTLLGISTLDILILVYNQVLYCQGGSMSKGLKKKPPQGKIKQPKTKKNAPGSGNQKTKKKGK